MKLGCVVSNVTWFIQYQPARIFDPFVGQITRGRVESIEQGKTSRALSFKDCGNSKLLYHGSRLSNWAGILSQGLKIAPPEAPVTGYMFGKGLQIDIL